MTATSSEAIFSSTALATRQREVKDEADRGIVHITENGNGAYIFCSEEVFSKRLQQVREEALYEAALENILQRAEEDIASGRISDDIESFRASMLEKRGLDD